MILFIREEDDTMGTVHDISLEQVADMFHFPSTFTEEYKNGVPTRVLRIRKEKYLSGDLLVNPMILEIYPETDGYRVTVIIEPDRQPELQRVESTTVVTTREELEIIAFMFNI